MTPFPKRFRGFAVNAMKRSNFSWCGSVPLTALWLVLASPAAAVVSPTLDVFTPSAAPAPADWKLFMEASDDYRKNLWDMQASRGIKLGSWSWGWRLGWMRACGASKSRWCLDILKDGLKDDALLVRAEAAKRLGERFRGTRNDRIVVLLEEASADARNIRNGKPLIVHERIMYALNEIGGSNALQAGTRVASGHASSMLYWNKLNRG